jgi:type IX secretion system PorP/SprF family membrane protein
MFGMFLPAALKAQDPLFSQFFAQKMYLNPALTGYEGGVLASFTTRDQWRNIGGSDAVFKTQQIEAAIDMPRLRSAFGLQLFSNDMGNSPENTLNWQKASFSYAFRNRSCNPYNDPDWEMSLGFRLSYNRFRIDYNNYIFGSQLDPIYGFNPQAPNPLSGISTGLGQDQFFDLDAGLAFRFRNLSWRGSSEDHLLLGLAVSHLPSRNGGFLGLGSPQSLRATFHGSYIIKIGGRRGYGIIPMWRSDMQFASGWAQPGSYQYWSNQIGVVGNLDVGHQFWMGLWANGRVAPNAATDAQNRLPSIYSGIMAVGTNLQLGYADNSPMLKLGMSMDYNLGGTLGDGGKTLEFFMIFHWPSATHCKCFTPFM